MRRTPPRDRLSSDDIMAAAREAGYLEPRTYLKDELIYVPPWLAARLVECGAIELVTP